MKSIITAPGVYAGITNEQYHGLGLTPEYALSSTGAREIDGGCPASFWHSSPLNPNFLPVRKKEFELGNAMHLLALEPETFGAKVVELQFDDYKTKACQEMRDGVREDGRIPLLTKELVIVRGMRDAIFAHPILRHAFDGCDFEQTIAWRDKETGVWLRCRPDIRPRHNRYRVDLKSTTSAHPRDFERAVWDYGYHMQADWYLSGDEALTGERPKHFFFGAIEKKPPFLVAVHDLEADAIAWGAVQNRRAIRTFAECKASGKWPGYRDPIEPAKDKAFPIGLPYWATRDLEKRHERGEFTTNAFERAAAAQAPLQDRNAAE